MAWVFIAVRHQAHEDVLERALRGVEIAEPDPGPVEVFQQRGDAGVRACAS